MTNSRTLPQWLAYLESIHPTTIDMGLDRVKQVADALNIQFDSRVIIVGGTNGKGTTCALMEQALLRSGQSVGVYSSPHLLDYRERVRVNGELPQEAAFCSAFEQVELARGNTSLTYFEFGTLAGMLMLMQSELDVVILEVGLGGRLDATNIVDTDIAVITSIGLDHQDWLGDTREKIATEKAGIITDDGKVVIGESEPPVTLIDAVKETRANALWQGKDFAIKQAGQGLLLSHPDAREIPLPDTVIPANNVATAFATLFLLGYKFDDALIKDVVANTRLPGRRQLIATGPNTYLDVGHNPQATESLANWLNKQSFTSLHIVIAMLKDKALAPSLAPFAAFNPSWYLASTKGPRGLLADTLGKAVPEGQAQQQFAHVVDAFHAARAQATEDALILVVGSFHTVADILALPHNTLK